MKRQIHFLKYLIILVLVSPMTISAQEDDSPLIFEASYVGDAISNFYGGLNNASAFLGMIDLGFTLNTESAGLWKNGQMYLQIENTHGGAPSGDYVCDFQCLSNIENGDHTYLYQLWYSQVINKLSLTIGVHDLNSEFLASDLAGEYVNSSFGIMPAVSMNVPVSIFPKNALAFIARYDFSDAVTAQVGFYDGDPLDLDQDPYNMNFKLSAEEGFLSIGEVHYHHSNEKNLDGTYKLGGFYHSGDFISLEDSLSNISGNYGIYLLADQKIVSFGDGENRGIGVFAQLGFSPKDRSMNNLFWSLGLNYYGPFAKRTNDVFGIALANAYLSSEIVNWTVGAFDNFETAIECMYKAQITENITFQPEVQYIINPGAYSHLDNAFVGLFRTTISF